MKMKLLKNQKGQGLTEYVIILSLIAIASLLAMKGINGTVRHMYGSIIENLQGNTHTADFSDVPGAKEISKSVDLSNFSEQ